MDIHCVYVFRYNQFYFLDSSSKDYLAVEDITGTIKGSRICGTKTNQSLEVDWHQSRVHFHSDNDITAQGFEASYRAFGSLPGK